MVDLFSRDQSVIARHIRNIFKERELDEKSNMHFLHIANSDKPVGGRKNAPDMGGRNDKYISLLR